MSTRTATRLAAGTVLAVLSASTMALGAASASAAGTGYWVDGAAACSDTGTGTQAAPFCTIGAAAKLAVNPGDTVHLAPAVYREQVTVSGSGTPADPISFVGDAPGVVISGALPLTGAGLWTATGTTAWSTPYAAPYAPRQVRVDGSRLAPAASPTSTSAGSWFYDGTAKLLYVDVGGGNPGDGHTIEAGAQSFGVAVTGRTDVTLRGIETRDQNFAGVRVLNSSSVTIDQVTATGAGSNGILVDTSSAVTVSHASVSDSLSTGIRLSGSSGSRIGGSTSHDNGLDGIALATSSGNVIDANTTYHNVSVSPNATGVGIDVNSGSPDNVVSDNVSYRNQDSGVQVYNGSNDVLVNRNVSYQNGDHGFDTLSATGARYLNNTSYGNNRDGISVEGSSTGTTLANNLLVDNGSATNEYDLYVDPGSVPGFTADYDVAYNHSTTPPVKFGGTVYGILAGFVAATGMERHGGASAPGFADPSAGNFALTGGSAAVDSADASVAGFTTTDAVGNPVVDDLIVPDTGAGSPAYADRGALEFQPSGAPADYPPNAALVLSPATVAVPPATTVTADAGGSADADAHGIASYTFDFDDGTVVGPQPSPTATHTFSSPGTYHVAVTVRDTAGLSDTATADEVVTARSVQTYHVEQGGTSCTDAGPGSQAAPFCSIGAAVKRLLAGDTVLVGPGQYHEQVQPTVSGEATAPITIKGTGPGVVVLGSDDLSDATGWTATAGTAWSHAFAPAANPTQVWLDGSTLVQAPSAGETTAGSWFYDATAKLLYVDVGGANPADGHIVSAGARNYGLLLRNVSDYDISGLSLEQANGADVYLTGTDSTSLSDLDVSQAGSYGVTVDGSTNAALDAITASDNQSVGIRFSGSSDGTLSSSVTHDNQFHGVSVQGSQRVVITQVTSYGNNKPGTRVATGIDVSSSSVDTVVQASTTYGNGDSGIEAYTGSTGTVIRRNVSYDNGDHGVDVSKAPNTAVVANTVVGNATAGINFEGGSTGGTSRDNISVENATASPRSIGDIRVDAASTAGTSIDRDLVYLTSGGVLFQWGNKRYSDLPSLQADGQEQAGIAADPRFADLAGRDLRLTGSSPAIDAAYTSMPTWRSADRDGTAPTDDPAVPDTGNGPDPQADLGALEYVGPVAVGMVSATSGYAPLDVGVDASPSVGLGSPLTGYRWDCGNGSTVDTVTGTCSFATAGSYRVQLTVTDGAGLADTWSTTVAAQPDVPATAVLDLSSTRIVNGQSVVADGSASTSVDKSPIATYRFDCGNGVVTGEQTSPTTTCTYPQSGNYTVRMWVTDTAGLVASTTQRVQVKKK